MFSFLLVGRRLASTYVALDVQMKQLNDKKKYRQAIDLFENLIQGKKQSTISSLAIDQAIRASTELKDYKRAIKIEENLSPDLIQNNFIRTRLIRLHSLLFLS